MVFVADDFAELRTFGDDVADHAFWATMRFEVEYADTFDLVAVFGSEEVTEQLVQARR